MPPSGAATEDKAFPSVRLGVARDAAFCFYYQDNLDLLARAGAELVPFSPLADGQVPPDLDGIYFGGGYPEVHAARLAGNTALQTQVRRLSRQGMPIYGECGGFMYLCRELTDQSGAVWPMTGCFPLATRMLERRKALGYREVTLTGRNLLGQKGDRLRGHEFHYSELVEPVADQPRIASTYAIAPRMGLETTPEGYRRGRTLGSYVHLHFGSRPASARAFVAACAAFHQQKDSSVCNPMKSKP